MIENPLEVKHSPRKYMFTGGTEWAAMTSFLRQGINVHGKEKVNGYVLVRTM